MLTRQEHVVRRNRRPGADELEARVGIWDGHTRYRRPSTTSLHNREASTISVITGQGHPRANRRWNDKGRSLSRLARARRNASGRAVTLTLTRIRTKREREGTREGHIDIGDGRETRHWASCVSSPSGSCAAKQGLVEKRVTVITRIPHCPPLGPRTRT